MDKEIIEIVRIGKNVASKLRPVLVKFDKQSKKNMDLNNSSRIKKYWNLQ